ncbi:isochorismate synthase [Metabacillus sp. RGM 3146]|uniref:isochorismate synthase n=1 Tax=Metabacillus sp. RGM 3146 TaxID=3401092 RepID=UPI003B9C4C60
MITTLQDTFKRTILSALDMAVKTGNPVIVSHVSKLDSMGPLEFFTFGKEMSPGERFFWMSPNGRQSFAGLGNELVITSEDKTNARFQEVEKEWKRFKKVVFYQEANDQDQAFGPLLLGGFSFDPFKNDEAKWKDFKEARFILPSCMLSKTDKGVFLTINKVIQSYDPVERCLEYFQKFQTVRIKKHAAEWKEKNPQQLSFAEHHKSEWMQSIKKATDSIKAGKLDKVVLARDITLTFNDQLQAEQVLQTLINEQKTSYIFAVENGESCFLGATPERLVKLEGQKVLSTCLAGSIKRGQTDEEDILLGETLLHDQKNLEEHDYVVQMIKGALKDCCDEVQIPQEPGLYKTKNIQHLFTPVEGTLKKGCSFLSIVETLHPTPALGGLPKEKAVEMIREIEPMDRGWYAGPVGWFDGEDNGEFAVAIRSALLRGKEADLYAGCGIVKDSEPESEYAETMIKLKPMLSALGGDLHEI